MKNILEKINVPRKDKKPNVKLITSIDFSTLILRIRATALSKQGIPEGYEKGNAPKRENSSRNH